MIKPHAIFFDLDETLVENVIPIQDLFGNVFSGFENELGAHQREPFFVALRQRIGGLWDTMFETKVSPEAQLQAAFTDAIAAVSEGNAAHVQKLGADMYAQFCSSSANNVRLHPGCLETLATLKSRGFITGIITNGIEQLQLGKIHQLGLQDEVDHVVVSAQARAHKPDVKVFELALSRAGVAASTAWQIGDHATNDVAGAIRAGMSGVFFDPSGELLISAFQELEVQPTHTVASLPQVLELLE